jgi:uncharacterized RDD family membrane protein YckC
VLPSAAPSCHFCDASSFREPSALADSSAAERRGNFASRSAQARSHVTPVLNSATLPLAPEAELAWRHELSQKLESYRGRRRKAHTDSAQTLFSFEAASQQRAEATENVLRDSTSLVADDFSFTIAIGRSTTKPAAKNSLLVIDLSAEAAEPTIVVPAQQELGANHVEAIFPIASLDCRRWAAVIDFFFVLFACGGFLGLFSSLGGQFTFSKLSTAVYAASFAIIYAQYFVLFTIFGNTTPGMMLKGIQVMNYKGEPPSHRQLALRSLGYILSGVTFGLGYLWALWDEDGLTWHDRLSDTYLAPQEELAAPDPSISVHAN